MAGLIRYSGIVTKVHAMNRRLLKTADYEALIQKETVPEALEFLKNTEGYAGVFSDEHAKISHRDAIERRLMDSLYTDFIGLYRFSGMRERVFLNSYFLHHEVMILKQFLRNAANPASPDVHLGSFDAFFRKHSTLNLDTLNHCNSLDEYMAALSGSAYEKPLTPIYNSGSRRLGDYETALDLFYFSLAWRLNVKKLSNKEKEDAAATLGTQIDLLNLQWIYRCHRHFSMDETDIYPMIIPIHYRLRPADIQALVRAKVPEEFARVLQNTYYAKWIPAEDLEHLSQVSGTLLGHIYRSRSRKNPYSIATINRYLYQKEEEIDHLIPIIEGIRYGLSQDEIRKFVPANL